MISAMDRTLLAFLTIAIAALSGCQTTGSGGMPPNMPIAGHKFAALKTGMTYADFEKTFGDGWLSPSSGTEAKYWFFDDGRTVVVPPEVWKVPSQKLTYRILGIAPITPKTEIPILQSKETLPLTTRPNP